MTKKSSHSLETPRLKLRPFTTRDVASYARIRAKPAVVRYLPGGKANVAQASIIAERTVSHCISLWENDPGYGPWAMVERSNGCLIGHMGLRKLPELEDKAELLYLLDQDFWGQGLATEAALASLEFGFEVLKLKRIIALVMPENTASIRVAERVGMKPAAALVKEFGLDLIEYSFRSKDWFRQRQATGHPSASVRLASIRPGSSARENFSFVNQF